MAQGGGRRSAKIGPRALGSRTLGSRTPGSRSQWRTLGGGSAGATKTAAKTPNKAPQKGANKAAGAKRRPRTKDKSRAERLRVLRQARAQRYLKWASFVAGRDTEFGYGAYFGGGSEAQS